jgi:hypothetical protein
VKSRPEIRQGEPIRTDLRKSIALIGQHKSDNGARQVVGDGMCGSECRVNQGDLSGTKPVFIALGVGTKSRPDRSQSIHISVEAG